MNRGRGKQYILNLMKEHTADMDFNHNEKFSAQYIADEIGLSRNAVSQYLNGLFEENLLIKINTRPVYYLHKETIENGLRHKLSDGVYLSFHDLKRAIDKNKKHSLAFEQLIGKSGSLSYVVEQCKSAVAYPENGLAILLHGPTGTGKSMIAQLMYNYGVERGFIGKESNFVVMNCSEFANNPELLLTNLFGYKKGAYTGADASRKGLVAAADGGVLFLDEVHCLKAECQEKLFLLMDKGIYHMIGDNENWHHAKVRMIFATTEEPENALLKTTLRRIPIVSRIPSLSARPFNEKKELIRYVLQKESDQLKQPVLISELAYQTLLNFDFTGNVGQLINCIKASVASSIMQTEDIGKEPVKIKMLNLPENILQNEAPTFCADQFSDNTVLQMDDLNPEINFDNKLLTFNRTIMLLYRETGITSNSSEYFLESSEPFLHKYGDYLFFHKTKLRNPKEVFTEKLLQNLCGIISEKYGFQFYLDEINLLCKFVGDYILNLPELIEMQKKSQKQLSDCISLFREKHYYDYSIASDLIKLIEDSIGVHFDGFGFIDIFLFIRSFKKWQNKPQPLAIAAAHGFSTASSLASTANQMIGQNMFDALDLPVSSNMNDMASLLLSHLNKFSGRKESVILFDIGTIEQLGHAVTELPDTDIILIDNVTLSLMLEVGRMLADGQSVETIYEDIESNYHGHRAVFVQNRQKPMAILTFCTTGMGMAEKIRDLIHKSFPKEVDISYVCSNYETLIASREKDPIFEKYNVLFIVGEIDPKIPGHAFVSIEEMIERVYTEEIAMKLSLILTKEEQEIFNRNIIKNFSLQNLLDYLIILNPEKIMSHVEVVINQIQQRLDIAIKNSTIVGLFLHISCLIERLITDRYVTSYANLEQFMEEEDSFIHTMKEIFKEIEKSYGVEIPISEIGYLYDHIHQ